MGAVWAAIEATRRAEALASEWALSDVLGRARINLVAFYQDIGDYGVAAETGVQLLQSELPEQLRAQLCHVHYNLARVYHAKRQHRMKYEQVSLALEAAERSGAQSSFVVMIHQQAAWWRYLGDQIKHGDEHLEAAGALLLPNDVDGAREQLLLACLRAHQTGDMEKAATTAEEFLLDGAPSTLLQRIWSAYIAASGALHLDRLHEAETLVGRALDWACEFGDPALMKRTNDLRRRIYQRKHGAGD
jgi:hypothetical protein